MYAYVGNDPVNNVDPWGLAGAEPTCTTGTHLKDKPCWTLGVSFDGSGAFFLSNLIGRGTGGGGGLGSKTIKTTVCTAEADGSGEVCSTSTITQYFYLGTSNGSRSGINFDVGGIYARARAYPEVIAWGKGNDSIRPLTAWEEVVSFLELNEIENCLRFGVCTSNARQELFMGFAGLAAGTALVGKKLAAAGITSADIVRWGATVIPNQAIYGGNATGITIAYAIKGGARISHSIIIFIDSIGINHGCGSSIRPPTRAGKCEKWEIGSLNSERTRKMFME